MTDGRPAGYISSIREHIGNDLLLLPAVTVLVTDELGRLLVVEQADRHEWSTVGGAVEPGESPAEAAVREAAEETGLSVELVDLVAVLGGPGYEITYPNGDRCAFVSIVYRARVLRGDLRPDGDEVVDCRWVLPAELDTLLLSPFTRRLLRDVGVLTV